MANFKLGNISIGYDENAIDPNRTQLFSAVEGGKNGSTDLFGWAKKKLNSAENAVGTGLAEISDIFKTAEEDRNRTNRENSFNANRDALAQKYGFANYDELDRAQIKAEEEGDEGRYDDFWNEYKKLTSDNANAAAKQASDYADYRQNSYAGQKINQDQGKYLGSAINTLSTLTDVLGVSSNPISNAIQGGVEGVADELEENGFANFNAQNAANRAISGAAAGAASGMLNNKLASGNGLFKGSNAVTRGINAFNNTGIGRGALSGAVGGAVGGGISQGMVDGNFIGGALEGAKSGALQGGVAGGTMSALNMGKNALTNRNKTTTGTAINANPTGANPINDVQARNNLITTDTNSDVIDLNSSFSNKGIAPIQKRNKLQAVGEKIQSTAKSIKYRDLTDSLDAKTAKMAVETDAPTKLAELGVKPADYEEYAKSSSYVNQVVSDLAKKSGVKTNVPDMTDKLSLKNMDILMTDNAARKYNDYISKIAADGDNPGEFTASYLLEKSRELGHAAANLRGNTDDVKALRSALTEAKKTIRDIATDALEKSHITGDDTNDMIAQGLAKLGANEKVQDYYTAANNGKAPTAADYIRRSFLFEQARDMGTQMKAEKLTRSASKAPKGFVDKALSASGLEEPVQAVLGATIAPISSAATNLVGKGISKVGDVIAGVSNGTQKVASKIPTNSPDTVNNATALWNILGRAEGNVGSNKAINNLEDAQANAENMDRAATLESLLAGANLQQVAPRTQSDVLKDAADIALAQGNSEAWYQLYSDYQKQLAAEQKENTGSSAKITNTQQRANAAMAALEELASMNPDTGYELSNIPLIGNIATLGGNKYQSAANSLLQQMGYMQSGANIKKEEEEAIKQAYIPQPWDSEQTRQDKLRRAKAMIQQYQNGYLTSSDQALQSQL